jgi:hypothetical protein
MQIVSRIVMLAFGLLGCGSVLADDRAIQINEDISLAAYAASLEPRFRNEPYGPIDTLEFYDNSALGRFKRFRGISFVTLSETRRSRIFLGVNSKGLVGLHLRIQ